VGGGRKDVSNGLVLPKWSRSHQTKRPGDGEKKEPGRGKSRRPMGTKLARMTRGQRTARPNWAGPRIKPLGEEKKGRGKGEGKIHVFKTSRFEPVGEGRATAIPESPDLQTVGKKGNSSTKKARKAKKRAFPRATGRRAHEHAQA